MFEEQSDKLIIRVIFSFLIIGIIVLYKYAHRFLYPSAKEQLFKKFYPSVNSADTLHLISRILGFSIIFTYLNINLSNGMLLAVADTVFQGILILVLYLVSLFVGESITLYNFTYEDEISKRKNLSYGVVSFSLSISIALILRVVLETSNHSLILLLFLWLFSIVLFGFCIKLFKYFSPLSFNKLMTQKNMALAFSFSGFVIGCALLINSSMSRLIYTIPEYIQLVFLKILLTMILFPVFLMGIKKVFLLQDESKDSSRIMINSDNPELGYGIYEGSLFLASAMLTVVVSGQIMFGVFYPIY